MGRSKAGKTFAQEAGFRGNGFKGYRGNQYTEGVRGRGKQYLMRYGANVNAQDSRGRTPLDYANNGSFNTCPIVPLLLRACAELPAGPIYNRYLSKVKDAGGIERYERAHLASRAATFIPKLAHLLPPELVRHVVEYWMHAGDY